MTGSVPEVGGGCVSAVAVCCAWRGPLSALDRPSFLRPPLLAWLQPAPHPPHHSVDDCYPYSLQLPPGEAHLESQRLQKLGTPKLILCLGRTET